MKENTPRRPSFLEYIVMGLLVLLIVGTILIQLNKPIDPKNAPVAAVSVAEAPPVRLTLTKYAVTPDNMQISSFHKDGVTCFVAFYSAISCVKD